MAIDLWSKADNSSLGMSPRISFSYDLCQADLVAMERQRSDSLLLESNDFDFCTSKSFEQDQDSSCADEIFSNGKILPIQVKKKLLPPKPPTHPTSGGIESSKKESLKDIMEKTLIVEDKDKPSSSSSSSSSSSKSFWRFKRSNSCGNGYTRSLICSLPLLSRSNSTGSAPNPKKTPSLKDTHNKPSPHKHSTSNAHGYPYSTQQNASMTMKKNYGSYNNGIRVSPVLNVPPPYISKGTVNLFGLGSLFCNGKEKNKKKRSEFSTNYSS